MAGERDLRPGRALRGAPAGIDAAGSRAGARSDGGLRRAGRGGQCPGRGPQTGPGAGGQRCVLRPGCTRERLPLHAMCSRTRRCRSSCSAATAPSAGRTGGRSELLGFRPGYATGKLFTAFIDLPSRAAAQTQLAAALRTGDPRQIRCGLLGAEGRLEKMLDIVSVTPEGDARQPPVGRDPAPRRSRQAPPPGTVARPGLTPDADPAKAAGTAAAARLRSGREHGRGHPAVDDRPAST